jgi:hypothetical protein
MEVDRLTLNHGARQDNLAIASAAWTVDALGMPGVRALSIGYDSRGVATVQRAGSVEEREAVGAAT